MRPRRKQFGAKKIKQPVQYFTRTAYRQAQFNAAQIPQSIGINFRLDNIPNVGEFTGLYDQYMIKAVKVTMIPRVTEAPVGSSVNTLANMWSVIDYDDSSAPANIDTMLQYQNVKHTQMNRTHTRYIKPCVADEYFATGVLTTYGARRNVWLDCSNSGVEHYGLKIYLDALPLTAVPIQYDVITKFYLAFKNVR